jgi:hypothetical protein
VSTDGEKEADKLHRGLPKWLRKGARLVRTQYATVDSLTERGFWAECDDGLKIWIPTTLLGVTWRKIASRAKARLK